MSDSKSEERILIIGAGPAGLGAALALNNNNYKNITIIEGRSDMNFDPVNSYPVGLNVRGQNAIKNLFGKSFENMDLNTLGLRVDQWKIIVGPGINVANFYSGLVFGTSRAEVTHLLYNKVKEFNNIKILFDHKAKEVNLESKSVICETNTGEEKLFKPTCVIIADGYRSKARDSLALFDKSLLIKQWPWNISFRVLTSEKNPTTELDPHIHYIQNQIYISKFLDGRWTAVVSIKDKSPEFLSSNEASDKNVQELENYLKKMAPQVVGLFTKDELRRYFNRTIFTGAVTKVSKLVIDKWAVLMGDAAHSAIPATGEGINSALEDCKVFQKSLETSNNLKDCLEEFENKRLIDANALSDIGYAAARPTAKSSLQMFLLGMFKWYFGPTKEDYLFGKESKVTQSYSEIIKIWKQQTRLIGGPNIPT